VAKNLASGDAAKAEGQIKEVVASLVKLGEEAPDKRMATLIQLFGSESIGSIGAAATAVDTLANAFEIAGDKAAAAISVQAEYDRVSNTTAARVEKLKANIGVLAVEFGDALLPHIDKVVNFLTSPEGQEWGASAVETAVEAVTGLAAAVGSLVEFFGFLVEKIGGAGVAVVGLGVAIAGLAGPLGLVAAAGFAMGSAIATAVDSATKSILDVGGSLRRLKNEADGIRADEARKQQDAERKEQVEASDGASAQLARERRAQAATDRWERQQRAGKALSGEESLAITRKAARMRGELIEGKFSTGSFEDRVGAFEASLAGDGGGSGGAGGGGSGGMARFNELAAKRKSGTLKPSEAKELRRLSKMLDVAIPKKGGRGHKATKMDQQLAAMDPALRHLLVKGGDLDAGGDLKVHDDVLSRGAFGAATRGKGGLGSIDSPGGGLGPGPNIQTTNFFNTFQVNQTIDARGQDRTAAGNIAAAANTMGQQVNQVQFVGAERVIARRNAGGRMA
jgi:hypothetical protein